MFAIFVGNIAMVLLLLFGRLIFELDYTIWRLFLEVILGIDVVIFIDSLEESVMCPESRRYPLRMTNIFIM